MYGIERWNAKRSGVTERNKNLFGNKDEILSKRLRSIKCNNTLCLYFAFKKS